MTTIEHPTTRTSNSWRDILFMLLLLAALAAVAAIVAWPWLPVPTPGGALLERYAPLHDGDAWLNVLYDADDTITGWRSGSQEVIPGNRAIAVELREAQLAGNRGLLSRGR